MLVTKEELWMLQKNLKTLRFIFGISYKDLAQYLRLTPKTVQRIESGKSKMTAPYYYAIKECFNDKRLDLSTGASSGTWYNSMYHLFTEKGSELWEKRRNHIIGVVWIFQMKYRKKVDYDAVRMTLYNLLKDLYTRPLYFSAKDLEG